MDTTYYWSNYTPGVRRHYFRPDRGNSVKIKAFSALAAFGAKPAPEVEPAAMRGRRDHAVWVIALERVRNGSPQTSQEWTKRRKLFSYKYLRYFILLLGLSRCIGGYDVTAL